MYNEHEDLSHFLIRACRHASWLIESWSAALTPRFHYLSFSDRHNNILSNYDWMYPAYMSATAHPSGISILVTSAEFFFFFLFCCWKWFIALQEHGELLTMKSHFLNFLHSAVSSRCIHFIPFYFFFFFFLKHVVWLISSLFIPAELSRAMCWERRQGPSHQRHLILTRPTSAGGEASWLRFTPPTRQTAGWPWTCRWRLTGSCRPCWRTRCWRTLRWR